MEQNIKKAIEAADQLNTDLLEMQKQLTEMLGTLQEHQKTLIELLTK